MTILSTPTSSSKTLSSGDENRDSGTHSHASRRSRREERRDFRRGGAGRVLAFVLAGILGLAAVIALILIIGAYTFLPGVVSDRVAAGIQEDFGLDREPEVTVTSDPQLDILRGGFSGGKVNIGAGQLFGFDVESIDVNLDPFDIDVRRSIFGRELVYETASSGTMTATVSSEEVARVALEESDVDGVSLSGGQLVVQREPRLFGDLTLPVEVRGELALRNPQLLVYTPQDVSVSGVGIPEDTADQILSGIELDFPIEEVGEGVTLREAEVEGDQLVLTGDIEGM